MEGLNARLSASHYLRVFSFAFTWGKVVAYQHHQHLNALLFSTEDRWRNNTMATAMPCWWMTSHAVGIAADPLGLRPLYYANASNITAIASDCHILLDLLDLPHTLNPQAVSGWLAGQPLPQPSLYRQIHRLSAGCSALLGPTLSTEHCYWDIDPHHYIKAESDDAYAQNFQCLLRQAVVDCLGQEKVVASQMSGGMDSTSVTALMLERCKETHQQPHVLSHFYPHDPTSDETALISKMCEHLKIRSFISQDVDIEQYRDFFSLYPPHNDHPGVVLSPRYADELALLQARGVQVLLTGNGGDECCWGHASTYTQRLKTGELAVIPEVYRACQVTGLPFSKVATQLFIKPMLPAPLLRLATLFKKHSPAASPPWLTSAARKLHEEAQTSLYNPFCARTAPARHARYAAMKTTSTFNSVRSYDMVAQKFNMRVAHPFFHPAVMAYSFAVPERQLIRGAFPKFLLRNAMQHHLPVEVCWRTAKTTFDRHFASLLRDNAESIRACLAHPLLADMGLIEPKALLKAFDNVINHSNHGVQVDMLFVILTQRWVQAFHAS